MYILLILYNIICFILYIPLGIAGYFLARAAKEDTHYMQRLGLGMPKMRENKPTFWFHAASVGETRSLKGIIASTRENYPQYGIIVSTMTVSGHDIAEKELVPDVALLLPIENRVALKHAIKCYNTKIFFITDTEIWPNLITAVSEEIPLILLNGRISDKTFNTYNRLSFIFTPLLQRFKCVIAKSTGDAQKFKSLTGGKAYVVVGGNIKYRMGAAPAVKPEMAFLNGRIALAASTHEPEEEFFLKAASKYGFDRVIIAPRHIQRAEDIRKTAQKLGLKAGIYSKGEIHEKILIVDAMGLLESLYQKSCKIFVGGSVTDIGGHNIFEALQYKKPVAMGTHMENFLDIAPLAEKCGVATVIRDENELHEWLGKPEGNLDEQFVKFFEELEETQKDYVKTVERCIAECIG